ncbi:MAG: nitroreductase family deazaflavin-dependent oxidoreductase [Chloroflexi bacterium]|nr:nitroreductase family deazaflavin-dependent oxidoreductase [Chloroflexota bacterium]
MAKTYRLTLVRRIVNWIVGLLLQIGLAPKGTYLLTVRGRTSGRLHSTPVTLIEQDGGRWLVAPYGAVAWVWNARAAGRVTLTRGGRSETVAIAELGPVESAPILKEYVARIPIVRPYFDATPESPLDTFVAEAGRHPVFRILGTANR